MTHGPVPPESADERERGTNDRETRFLIKLSHKIIFHEPTLHKKKTQKK